jgi:chromosome segregation ATPase
MTPALLITDIVSLEWIIGVVILGLVGLVYGIHTGQINNNKEDIKELRKDLDATIDTLQKADHAIEIELAGIEAQLTALPTSKEFDEKFEKLEARMRETIKESFDNAFKIAGIRKG